MEQIVCRLTIEEKQAFQMKCLQENVKMQTVLKDAVIEFTQSNSPKGQLSGNQQEKKRADAEGVIE